MATHHRREQCVEGRPQNGQPERGLGRGDAQRAVHRRLRLYQWDEVGRLTLARRLDGTTLGAELRYQYDASDARVLKTVGDRHTVNVFSSLELRLATYSAGAYEVTAETEVPYLSAHGMRLARVVHTTSPSGTPATRVFLELGDHLGTTSVLLDRESGEVVQRSTAYSYGAPEIEYRPERWGSFREDYRFTGKEDDVEVGLIYSRARYYAPLLDAPVKADLNLFAYVHGRVLVAVDPVGLDEPAPTPAPAGGAMQPPPPDPPNHITMNLGTVYITAPDPHRGDQVPERSRTFKEVIVAGEYGEAIKREWRLGVIEGVPPFITNAPDAAKIRDMSDDEYSHYVRGQGGGGEGSKDCAMRHPSARETEPA